MKWLNFGLAVTNRYCGVKNLNSCHVYIYWNDIAVV